uniref:Putative salp15 n=1 Tax=Ixodes ricinus TaxID=34613 RepID=A0A0K8RBL7_IXORI
MKNTGLFFFIMRTTRLILAMFVLFAICKAAVATVAIKGMEQMAPNCVKTITDLCERSTVGELEEVQVAARNCEVTCTYRPPGPKTVEKGGLLVQNRDFKKVNLPNGMPCAFGAICDNSGKCSCPSCKEDRK